MADILGDALSDRDRAIGVRPSQGRTALRRHCAALWTIRGRTGIRLALGIPRIITLLLFALLVALLWDRFKAYRRVQLTATPQKVTPKPLTGDDLTEQQRQLLIFLWRRYPNHTDLHALVQIFELTYPALERLVESVEEHGLVEITSRLYQAKSVFMTKAGRDFCHDNGLAVDHLDMYRCRLRSRSVRVRCSSNPRPSRASPPRCWRCCCARFWPLAVPATPAVRDPHHGIEIEIFRRRLQLD